MTRARELSKLGNINALSVDSSNNVGVGSTSPDAKLDVAGIVSATYFYGDGSNITNAGSTLAASSGTQRLVVTSLTSGTMTSAGTDGDLTWNSSTNTLSATNFAGDGSNLSGIDATTIKDSGGVVRVQGNTSGIVVSGITSGLNVTGVATIADLSATAVSIAGTLTYEDVTNVDSIGVITARSGVVVTGTCTATSFSGDGSGITGLPGLTTEAVSGSNTILTLDLSKDEHKVTTTGITTITTTGGTEGNSHVIRIINSGISTVGFSSYFLWPGGSAPYLPTSDGAMTMVSFSVNKAGSAGIGTQLFATAALNFS